MARIIDKGSAPPDDPLFSGRIEFFSVGALRPSVRDTAAGPAAGVAERGASAAEQRAPTHGEFNAASLPEGTVFFAKDELPVFRVPGGSPTSAVTGAVVASTHELEVVDRVTFDSLVANWSKRFRSR